MPKKIITHLEADKALCRVAVRLIESMELLSRTRRIYPGNGNAQFDESQFEQREALDQLDIFSDFLQPYYSGIAGFVDETGNRRGLESLEGFCKGCTWSFTAVVMQHLKEARGKLEGLCYPQKQKRVKGPVLTRNP